MFTCVLLRKINYYYYYYYWIFRVYKQWRHYVRNVVAAIIIYDNKNTLLVCGLSLIPLNCRGGGLRAPGGRGRGGEGSWLFISILTITASVKPLVHYHYIIDNLYGLIYWFFMLNRNSVNWSWILFHYRYSKSVCVYYKICINCSHAVCCRVDEMIRNVESFEGKTHIHQVTLYIHNCAQKCVLLNGIYFVPVIKLFV